MQTITLDLLTKKLKDAPQSVLDKFLVMQKRLLNQLQNPTF